jgi:hypothetical protein
MGQRTSVLIAVAAALIVSISAFGSPQDSTPSTDDLLSIKIRELVLEDQTVFDGLAKLNQMIPMSFAVERQLTSKESPKLPPVMRFTGHVDNVTLRGALDWLFKLDARHTWTTDNQVINVFPKYVQHDPAYPLNQQISYCELKKTPSASAAVIEAARHTNPPEQLAVLLLGDVEFDKPITLTLKEVTLREALNRIAQALGPAYGWQFSGTLDFRYVVFHKSLVPGPSPPH